MTKGLTEPRIRVLLEWRRYCFVCQRVNVLTRNPAISESHGVTMIAPWLLRLIRVGLLVILFILLLSTVIAFGGPGTGPLEKSVLVAVFLGLLGLAVSVHRIGRAR